MVTLTEQDESSSSSGGHSNGHTSPSPPPLSQGNQQDMTDVNTTDNTKDNKDDNTKDDNTKDAPKDDDKDAPKEEEEDANMNAIIATPAKQKDILSPEDKKGGMKLRSGRKKRRRSDEYEYEDYEKLRRAKKRVEDIPEEVEEEKGSSEDKQQEPQYPVKTPGRFLTKASGMELGLQQQGQGSSLVQKFDSVVHSKQQQAMVLTKPAVVAPVAIEAMSVVPSSKGITALTSVVKDDAVDAVKHGGLRKEMDYSSAVIAVETVPDTATDTVTVATTEETSEAAKAAVPIPKYGTVGMYQCLLLVLYLATLRYSIPVSEHILSSQIYSFLSTPSISGPSALDLENERKLKEKQRMEELQRLQEAAEAERYEELLIETKESFRPSIQQELLAQYTLHQQKQLQREQEKQALDAKVKQALNLQPSLYNATSALSELQQPLSLLRKQLSTSKTQLLQWEKALDDFDDVMTSYDENDDQDDANALNISQINEALLNINTFSSSSCDTVSYAMDIEGMTLIGENCNSEKDPSALTSYLDHTTLSTAEEELLRRAQSSMESLYNSNVEDSVKKGLIQSLIGKDLKSLRSIDLLPEDHPHNANAVAYKKHKSMLLDALFTIIETDRADRTNEIDYAAIHSGSQVIHSMTSSSLVNHLSLYHRLLSSLRLRFYGFPAEAALSPTTRGVAGLGQCWAVLPEDKMTMISNYHRGGAFATLVVQLSKEVHVTSVVVEHPIGLTPDPDTAVKKFRVYGYHSDNDSDVDPSKDDSKWELLGQFLFDVEQGIGLQEFEVKEGFNLPKMRAVALAIDSNWGGEYSCLYRFRVHGRV